MKEKIIAIDLDGTLLHSDNTISDYSLQVIQKVQDKGHQVIIATGRPYTMAREHYQRLGLKTPMISFNGALTHLPEKNWVHEQSLTIPRSYLFDLLKQQETFLLDFVACEFRDKFFISIQEQAHVDPSLFGVSEFKPETFLDVTKVTKSPNAILVQTSHPDKYRLAQDIRLHFDNQIEVDSWGGPLNILEMAPKGVNKASALKYLLQLWHKTPQDLIAFGDEHNDTEMLALAGQGFAMKNANPILLPFADQQIAYTNEEDGVAKTLESLFL